MACIASFISCECDDERPSNIIQDVGGGGDFTIVNTETNETLIIDGNLSIGLPQTIKAHKGNIINIKFEQKEKYKNYIFTTKYTLPNDEMVADQSEYEYIIRENLGGLYEISLSANSSGETKKEKWNISAGGRFILNVVQ